jgi:HTH-type transcriptional regulator, sugar sensing transcriptional regulator
VRTEESVRALTALGFTGLEAEVYAFLLSEPPATGYRVAQALGRPVANVYKALESLESKGAVVVDQGETRLSRAVPSEELLKRLERDYARKAAQARDVLEALKPAPADGRVYQLRSIEQVFERCRSMLSRAKTLIVADLFPDPLAALKPDIEAAAGRGVSAIVKVFGPAEVQGAKLVWNPRGPELVEQYPGQWAIVVIDGAELLIAAVDSQRRTVHQAIWTESPTLSWIVHTSLTAEMMFCEVCGQITSATDVDSLKEAVRPFAETETQRLPKDQRSAVEAMQPFHQCYSRNLAGFQALVEQFGTAEHRVDG